MSSADTGAEADAGRAAADSVANMAEENGAQGPHEEADGENGIGGEERGARILGREIEAAKGAGEEGRYLRGLNPDPVSSSSSP